MAKLRAVLRRRWPLLVITTVVGLVAGAVSARFASSGQVEQVYTASQVVVANPNSGASPLIPQDELKVTRGPVPVRAAELLGRPGDAAELAARIDTEFDTESSSITISSNDADPDAAQERVQAFTTAFLDITNTKLQAESRRQLDTLRADLASAEQELATFDATYPQLSQPGAVVPNDPATQALLAQRAELVRRADDLEAQIRQQDLQISRTAPYESLGPEKPRPAATGLVNVPTSAPVRAGLLGLLGLLLGGVAAMVIERVNRRIDTREELAEVLDLPILAEIGHLRERRRAHDPDGTLLLDGVWAEPYRRVRSAIQFVRATAPAAPGDPSAPAGPAAAPGPPQVFLITSTSPGEGKSTTVALTGQALAEVGVPTVVIGGDFRRPEVDRLLGVPRDPSLRDLARMDPDRPTIDDVVRPSRFANLYVAPAGRGTREVAGLIGAAREVAAEARARGATVLFDSSPLQAANDTIDLLSAVDRVILVVRAGRSTEAGLLDAVDTLRRMGTPILGVVLIGTQAGRQQSYYYDYYSPVDEPNGTAGPSNGTRADVPGAAAPAPPPPPPPPR